MEKGSIMLDREASSLPQLVGKYVVLSSYPFISFFLPIHEFSSMQLTFSVSRVEYSRTFILSLCYKTSKVYCRCISIQFCFLIFSLILFIVIFLKLKLGSYYMYTDLHSFLSLTNIGLIF